MAKELELKYGCNPNQKPARIFMKDGELPIEVLNGRPGFINLRQTRLHQLSGCIQQLAISKRAERSYRTSGCRFLQACQPGRCCRSGRNE